MSKRTRILNIRPAGDDHQVVTVASDGGDVRYCKKPCEVCPWRIDATGVFPASAFKHSAPTTYDMASNTFACHTAGADRPAVCAGFLLRGADHNLTVRLHRMRGKIKDDVCDAGHVLFANYREMAVANGVDPEDVVLDGCR